MLRIPTGPPAPYHGPCGLDRLRGTNGAATAVPEQGKRSTRVYFRWPPCLSWHGTGRNPKIRQPYDQTFVRGGGQFPSTLDSRSLTATSAALSDAPTSRVQTPDSRRAVLGFLP